MHSIVDCNKISAVMYFNLNYQESAIVSVVICNFYDASKSGVAQETLQNAARRASKVMTEQEARQILGVSQETAWEEILKASIFKYDVLFERNAKNGSFYLQSKVHRAKECLEAVYGGKGAGTPPPPPPPPS
ncbi:Mitochondrial import inner membrane translocase subunit Tim16 [Corchorus olitorius]|uniref:Mitochondrial import inner membrane translocase subunit Tim16 n=1 Tax=Corchorus olitorius TaxID=93759 RepID=A0A1R3IAT9_9ROSI|nr:Mitochondrial import inner membrane translocase subunit Tim16 [Corchorus olitorius]